MKKKLLFARLSLLAGLIMVFGSQAYASPLAGVYSIDTNQVASATNFRGFTAAIDSLKLNGVSGPVVFMVAANTYNRQVTISGAIPGASPTNTVTFDGGNASATTITYACPGTTTVHTLKLENVKYVTFRNFTIRATGASAGWAVHIMSNSNGASNANKIKKCIIEITGSGTTSTGQTYNGIVANSSLTAAATTAYRIDSLEIDSNTINYGAYGIICYASSVITDGSTGNKIRNNKITNSYTYGIQLYGHDGIEISGNQVAPRLVGNGIGMNGNSNFVSANRIIISGNKITNFNNYGIYLSSASNTAAAKGLIINNMIGGGLKLAAAYGIYMSSSSYWNVCNNSINRDFKAAAVTASGLYILATSTHINILNNIFSETKDGSLGVNINAASAASIDSMDYNIFYKMDLSDGKLLVIGTANSYDDKNFKIAPWNNANSIFVNPGYASDSDLHISAACNLGLSLPFITTDIEGTARDVRPVIGAHEAQLLSDNIALIETVSPVYPISTGTQDLVVKIQNLGSSMLTSFDIAYSVDGAAPVIKTWTGFLAKCGTTDVVFNGSQQLNMVEEHHITISTRLPNGGPDMDTQNDTLLIRFAVPLNGTYTLGQTSAAHFSSFNDALDRLFLGGVSGPVVFTVDTGTYREQVVIDKNIPGLSAVNTITFDGVNAATRILTYTSKTKDAWELPTLQISQSHIRIRNLTVKSDTTAFGMGIVITSSNNDATDIHLKNNIINVASTVITTSAGITIGSGGNSRLASGSVTKGGSTGSKVDSLQVDSNTITGGYYGIQMSGSTDSTLISYNHYYRNNKVTGCALTGIAVSDVAGVVIQGNKISNILNPTNLATSAGISYGNANVSKTYVRTLPVGWNTKITGNIVGPVKTGINVTYIINNPANRGLVANNVTSGPINLTAGGNFDIYHNSALAVDASAFTMSRPATATDATGNVIKNNHFVVSGATSLAIPFVVSDLVSLAASGLVVDYNNYYRPDHAGSVITLGASYSLADFAGGGGYNVHSTYIDPEYPNDTTLISANPCINGDMIAAVPADINNVVRNMPPDIGAYELASLPVDIGMVLLNPVTPYNSGMQNVHVRVRNMGVNVINSFEVIYVHNNGTPVTRTWTGTLGSCDTVSVIFTGAEQINLAENVNNTLNVYTRNPNNITDMNTSNDSVNLQIYTAMSGAYTIGGTSPSFATFNAAKSALVQRGVSGPVVFNVRTNTYNEQVEFMQVAGASEINTITFRAETGNRNDVTLNFNATVTADNYVIRLLNASYFNFKLMTIKALNATNGRVIELSGVASYDTIESCNITGIPTTATNVALAGIYATAYKGKNLVIRNNTFLKGCYGVYITAATALYTSNVVVDKNVFQDVFLYGVLVQYGYNTKVWNNTFSSPTSSNNQGGIYLNACDSAMEVVGNKISGMNSGYGISTQGCRGTRNNKGLIANNVVSSTTGAGQVSAGLYNINSTWMRIYNNTISVNTANANTAAGYINYNGAADTMNDIRNNIFACNATTNTGAAMYCNIVAAVANLNIVDYNNLYSGSTNLVKGGATYTSMAAWKASTAATTAYDKNSVSYNPGFTDAVNNPAPNLSNPAIYSINGRGIYLADVPADINGTLRPATYSQGATDIGAYEFTPAAATLAPAATATGNIGHDSIQVFTFAGDTVARIKWDPLSGGNNIPASISVRQYSGIKPPVGDASQYMYFYTDVDVPAGSYGYTIETYYRENWLGTITAKENLKMINKPKGQAWVYAGVSSGSNVTDTIRHILKDHAVDNLGYFTGTDMNNPLPVRLLNLSAGKRNRDVVVNWSTASELNSSLFEVERMRDGRWTTLGRVKAAGSSQSVHNYQFIDQQATSNSQQPATIYYRLKMVDRNGSFTYSKTVSVRIEGNRPASGVSVYPNPFNNEVFISLEAGAASTVKVEWMDITGKTIASNVYTTVAGTNVIDVSTGDVLKAGIYFVSVEAEGVRQVQKMVKQ